MCRQRMFLGCVAILATALAGRGQDGGQDQEGDAFAARKEEIKRKVGFDKLPGRDGLFKPGLRLDVGAIPELRGYRVERDTITPWHEDDGVTRVIGLFEGGGEGHVEITLYVADRSIPRVHEEVFDELSMVPRALLQLFRGDQAPARLAIGDWSFLVEDPEGLSVDTGQRLGYFIFARNNIGVSVSRNVNDGFKGGIPNILKIAKRIDDIIVAEKGFRSLEDSKKKPKVERMEIDGPIPVGGTRNLRVVVSSPEDKAGDLIVVHDNSPGHAGVVSIDEMPRSTRGGTRTFTLQGSSEGVETIRVAVINSRLLMAAKTIRVAVSAD
jgi:hypothetical protein